MYATWLIDMCAITHPHMRRDAFICATQIYNTVESYATYCQMQLMDSLTCVPLLVHICDVTHSYVQHKYITRQNHTWHTAKCSSWTHWCALHHSFTHVTCLFGRCDMTRLQQHTATHCNTLQHTATHCNTLQHIGRCDMTRIQGVVFSGENTGKTEWILITTLIYAYIMLQVWGLLPNTSFELVISRGLFLPSGLYICIHTYIYIYTCIYIYKHTHTQTLYIYTYTHTQTHGCKCTNT